MVGQGNTKEGAWGSPENNGGYDGIISPITPVNTMTGQYEQVFTVNPENSEDFPKYIQRDGDRAARRLRVCCGRPGDSTMWSPSGEEITNVNTSTEEGEIKA